jgi:hypothetical protein
MHERMSVLRATVTMLKTLSPGIATMLPAFCLATRGCDQMSTG